MIRIKSESFDLNFFIMLLNNYIIATILTFFQAIKKYN